MPVASVVPDVGDRVPQEAPPEVVKVTVSPGIGRLLGSVTVAVTVEVDVPLAGTFGGLAETATWEGGGKLPPPAEATAETLASDSAEVPPATVELGGDFRVEACSLA